MFAALLSAIVSLHALFGSVTVQSYICQPPDKPAIVSPADGSRVTAGNIDFTGSATASSQVTLMVDGQAAAQLTADQFNAFQAQLTLAAGSHTVGIASTSPCGDATGDDISLTASAPPVPPSGGGSSPSQSAPPAAAITAPPAHGTTPPPEQIVVSGKLTLSVAAPIDGTSTKQASIFVRGTTSALAKIQIAVNGAVVAQTLLPGTSFGLAVPLELNDNTITVSATGDNTLASVTLHVTRIFVAAPSPSSGRVSWWRTPPGIATAGASIIVVLGLTIWFIRPRLAGASKPS